MKRVIGVCLLLLANVCMAQAGTERFLPQALRALVFGTTTPAEVAKVLGPAKEVDRKGRETVLHYNLQGIDFDTSFRFTDDKLRAIHLAAFAAQLSFPDFKGYFSMEELQVAREQSMRPVSHESGRFIDLGSPAKGLYLRLANTPALHVLELTMTAPLDVAR